MSKLATVVYLFFANMIKSHNNRILSEEKTQDQPKCNCRQKDTCPLQGNCLDKELIYQGECEGDIQEACLSVTILEL